MAEVVWTEPALSDLDAIADYVALEHPSAAAAVVQRVLKVVDQLVVPPCRIFYRDDGARAFVLHVLRSERKLRASRLARQERPK